MIGGEELSEHDYWDYGMDRIDWILCGFLRLGDDRE